MYTYKDKKYNLFRFQWEMKYHGQRFVLDKIYTWPVAFYFRMITENILQFLIVYSGSGMQKQQQQS